MQHVLRELREASSNAAARPDPVPAEVRAIDLARLASLVGCSVEDLAGGIRRGHLTSEGDATVAAPAERVAFKEIPRFVPSEPAGIDLALLSLASRPGVLDSATVPKCLMLLGAQPVIGHVLTQLHAGGVRRVVIVLGARGDVIRPAIARLHVASKLRLQFIELGPAYAGGFARSLLSAAATVRRRLSIPQRPPADGASPAPALAAPARCRAPMGVRLGTHPCSCTHARAGWGGRYPATLLPCYPATLLPMLVQVGADPFMLATADHIFDTSIVREMRTCLATRAHLQAVALVVHVFHTCMSAPAPCPCISHLPCRPTCRQSRSSRATTRRGKLRCRPRRCAARPPRVAAA